MDANISAYDLASSYMVGYEAAIKGGCLGIMCAYNSVNGKPCCANSELLETLRVDWNFSGYESSSQQTEGNPS